MLSFYEVSSSIVEPDHNNECKNSLINCKTEELAKMYILNCIKHEIYYRITTGHRIDYHLPPFKPSKKIIAKILSSAEEWLQKNSYILIQYTQRFFDSADQESFEGNLCGEFDSTLYEIKKISLVETEDDITACFQKKKDILDLALLQQNRRSAKKSDDSESSSEQSEDSDSSEDSDGSSE